MSETKSPILRLFGWIWRLLLGVYRVIIILLVVLTLVGVWFALQGGPPVHVEKNVALALVPSGNLVEQESFGGEDLLRQISGGRAEETVLRDLTDALRAAADDPRISLAVLKLDELQSSGLAQMQDLGAAMQAFRAKGKPIYVYGESFDQNQYYAAAQADEISLDPMGMVLLEGYGVYTNFFKDALDKLGVQINVFRVGEYKSAIEPFVRNDMSPDAKEANQAWLADLWTSYNQGVAQARKLPDGAADAYARAFGADLQKEQGDAATLALDRHLVTRVETLAEFRKRVGDKVGFDKDKGSFRQIDFASYLRAVHREKKPASPNKIALVVVQGDIVDGDSDTTSAGGDTISELLDRARRDDSVQAVVLRVNSPGGSVFASEKIRRAVQALQDDGKPVVASMSTLAASGGYWISMEADQIWAEPSTITGSIGIFGLFPTIDQPLTRLGIHTDGVGTTPLSGAFRIDRPLNADMKALLQTQIEKGYRDFVQGVADGRDLDVKDVDKIARGRVWSGIAAKGLGLVDELGGLSDAVAAAAELAGLDKNAYQLYEMEPERSYLTQVLGQLLGGSQLDSRFDWGALARLVSGSRAMSDQAQSLAALLKRFDDPRGIYAYCFCTPAAPARTR